MEALETLLNTGGYKGDYKRAVCKFNVSRNEEELHEAFKWVEERGWDKKISKNKWSDYKKTQLKNAKKRWEI